MSRPRRRARPARRPGAIVAQTPGRGCRPGRRGQPGPLMWPGSTTWDAAGRGVPSSAPRSPAGDPVLAGGCCGRPPASAAFAAAPATRSTRSARQTDPAPQPLDQLGRGRGVKQPGRRRRPGARPGPGRPWSRQRRSPRGRARRARTKPRPRPGGTARAHPGSRRRPRDPRGPGGGRGGCRHARSLRGRRCACPPPSRGTGVSGVGGRARRRLTTIRPGAAVLASAGTAAAPGLPPDPSTLGAAVPGPHASRHPAAAAVRVSVLPRSTAPLRVRPRCADRADLGSNGTSGTRQRRRRWQ